MRSAVLISGASKPLLNFRGDLIKELIDRGFRVYTISPDPVDFVEQELQALGVRMIYVKMGRTSLNIIDDIVYLFTVKRIIKQLGPDYAYPFTIKPVIFGTMGAWLGGCRNIFPLVSGLGIFGVPNLRFKLKVLRLLIYQLYFLSFLCSRRVIFQNDEDREQLVKARLVKRGKTVRVMGSGVNLQKFPAVVPSIDPIRFIFVGRLIRQKGIYDFIEAAEIVKRQRPDSAVRFSLLGQMDDTPGAISMSEVQALMEAGIVEYIPKQRDVRPYLQNSSIFVLPSYYGEGIPRTALEALSTGLPIIMSDSRGCRDVVLEEENGFKVPIQNPSILASRMVYFIDNPDRILEMGRRSRSLAERLFDVRKVNCETLKIMEIE